MNNTPSARWEDAAATPGPRTLEFLAFAEGRFLTIHPFRDFNGRTIRLVLRELLRRLDFLRIHLEPEPGPATVAEAMSTRRLSKADIVWRGIEHVDADVFQIIQNDLRHRPIRAELFLVLPLPVRPNFVRKLRGKIEISAREVEHE